jgi:hypothetical protein
MAQTIQTCILRGIRDQNRERVEVSGNQALSEVERAVAIHEEAVVESLLKDLAK